MAYTEPGIIFSVQPDVEVVGDVTIYQAIADAEAEINGHLARLYTLPITGSVPLLTALATDIAIFRIFTGRPFQGPPRPVESAWGDRYKAAIAMLLRLSAGEMVLTTTTGEVIAANATDGGAWSSTMRYHPTFGEGADQGFFVDRTKLADEAERRS